MKILLLQVTDRRFERNHIFYSLTEIHVSANSFHYFTAAIESCLLHKLKKRIGGLLPSASSDEVLVKLSKFCESGEMIMQLAAKIQSPNNKINSG